MVKSEKQYDYIYKKLHAMYSRGCELDEMYAECRELAKWEVLEIVQTIEGKKRQMEEKRAARY